MKELFKKASEIWKSEDGFIQKKYIKIAESDKKRFKEELKQLEKLGYYKRRRLIFQNSRNIRKIKKYCDFKIKKIK